MNTRILNFIAAFLCCAGIVVAGFLSYAHAAGVSVPCGISGGGCDAIQNHPSSIWFGIPVAYFGFAGYVLILLTLAARVFSGKFSNLLKVGFALSIVGALVSIGLQIYGAMVIHATCDWCMASAAIMCGLALVHALMVQGSGAEATDRATNKKLDMVVVAIFVVGSIASLGLIAASNSGGSGTVVDKTHFAKDPLLELTEGAPSMGPKDAPITIIEFADLFCGSCRVSFEHMKKLQAQYPGKIRWVFRHFPLYNKEGHELSLPTAVVAEYSGRQGKFWQFIGQVFSTSEDSMKTMEDIYRIANNVNVDTSSVTLAIEVESSPELKRVTEDMNLANRIGIQETPTFLFVTKGQDPIALRTKDLDTKMNSAPIQELLKP